MQSLSSKLSMPVYGEAQAVSPLSPEGIGASVESVLEFKTRPQGSHVAPARPPTAQQTVRGGGGGQGATAVTGSWRHQL